MREVAGYTLAFLGLSIAVLAGTGDRLDTADFARREACQRAISYGVVAISGSDQRVDGCMAATAHRYAESTLVQVASSDVAAVR